MMAIWMISKENKAWFLVFVSLKIRLKKKKKENDFFFCEDFPLRNWQWSDWWMKGKLTIAHQVLVQYLFFIRSIFQNTRIFRSIGQRILISDKNLHAGIYTQNQLLLNLPFFLLDETNLRRNKVSMLTV